MTEYNSEATTGFYTIAEFSSTYRVCRTKTYELIKQGALRAVKAGARTLILKAEAERWAKSLPALITAKDSGANMAVSREAA